MIQITPMSALGQFRPISVFRATSGLPPKATEMADIMGVTEGQSVSALPRRLDVNLLRNRDGIVYLDAKISNRAFDFGVTKKQLHGPQISGAPINQRCLGSAERMCAIDMRVKPNTREPIG